MWDVYIALHKVVWSLAFQRVRDSNDVAHCVDFHELFAGFYGYSRPLLSSPSRYRFD